MSQRSIAERATYRPRRVHARRGQVLPMWAMGTITAVALTFLALNYGNAVRYQMRAQNAADSAAQALVAIQAERFNLMEEMLYASNVEEYRFRRLLDGILLSINYSGGCSYGMQDFSQNDFYTNELDPKAPYPYVTDKFFTDYDTAGSCNRTYMDLHDNLLRSLNRYTSDITYLNDVTSQSTYESWLQDANSLLTTLTSNTACNQVGGADCAFKYTMLSPTERGTGGNVNCSSSTTGPSCLLAVVEDAQSIFVPRLGLYSSYYGANTENPDLFAPVEVDMVTCAVVPPIVPSFGPFHLQPTYAIGRAAATDVQMEQDWLDPGAINDPIRTGGFAGLFQPVEMYTQPSYVDTGSGPDWYSVDYGGNKATDPNGTGFSSSVYTDEMSARMGWWNAIPITPYAGTVNISQVCPTGSAS